MSDEGTRTGPSRRWVLAGGVAAAVGAGIGVGVGFLQPTSAVPANPAPAALTEAIAAERELLALIGVAVRRDPSLSAGVAALKADHAAHLHALQSALARYDAPHAAAAPTPTLSTTPSLRAQLRAAERSAAASAAARATRLTGAPATLLASISACESTHAAYLA